jgi:PAS domain S-box-containing protein
MEGLPPSTPVQILRHMPSRSPREGLSLRAWLLLTSWAAGIVFALDLLAPPTVAVAVLYVLVVLASLRASDPRAAVASALICSVLSWIDALLTHRNAPGVDWLAQIALVLIVIWVAAFLVHRYMMVARAWVERSVKELEDIRYAIDQSAIVATTDTRGVIRFVNDKFCEVSRYSRDELLGRDHRLINSGFHSKAFFRDLWQTIASGRIWKGELRNRAKDGSIYWVDTTIVPFLDEQGKPYQYMAIRYEITERKRSEALLREQAALTRLGEMAAVVAHEVKNPLAGIRGALQVISGRMPPDSRDRSVVGDILARLDSLNELVHDLLLFARPRAPRMTTVQVEPLVEATALLLRRDPQFANVELSVTGNGHAVDADAELLQIVFSNLLVNSAQAMGGDGRVAVSVRPRDSSVDVIFEDTGPGIPSDVRERMFEPFFTTKHRGTGLGLSTARRLIEQHGGRIAVDCPVTGGTVVTVSLPAARPVAVQAADAVRAAEPVPPAGGQV